MYTCILHLTGTSCVLERQMKIGAHFLIRVWRTSLSASHATEIHLLSKIHLIYTSAVWFASVSKIFVYRLVLYRHVFFRRFVRVYLCIYVRCCPVQTMQE